jgi:hypothetical protein
MSDLTEISMRFSYTVDAQTFYPGALKYIAFLGKCCQKAIYNILPITS